MIKCNRRKILCSLGGLIPLGLAGCYGASDYPRHRHLGFDGIEVIEQSDSTYVVQVTPSMSWAAESEEWATFHEVVLSGFSESGKRVCQRELGDVRGRGSLDPVTLTCSAFPHVILYRASKSPCEEDTRIERAEYSGKREERHVWTATERECEPSTNDG